MARILITSGPTRQYLDPVRYLTNASSGRMGAALAATAVANGHDVVLVSGPVEITYPESVELHQVISTEEMLEKCIALFSHCDGMIGVAAPCDYRPEKIAPHKIAKTGDPLQMQLIETEDIVARLGKSKANRWVVGFALETEDPRLRALVKLEKKSCDLMVLNGVDAMHSPTNAVEVLEPSGESIGTFQGMKEVVAAQIFQLIEERLITSTSARNETPQQSQNA
ncbi:MAG: phosphopantothenoylcysteine decarboxylase [Planctomycetota bacterium]|nr:phosphopantothenoylcysteine decarboxylase [Planctomycetota bacterium]MEC8338480.1 phosphopantothenoylcysteine decarboxylase [Planctomycetota bacterium]